MFSCLSGLFGPTVPEHFCVPGDTLYKHERVDHAKLRKLIQEGKLCPLFPGAEDAHPPPPGHDVYVAVLTKVLRQKKKLETSAAQVNQALSAEYEACPICFLHYPALNTSRCCAKRVCTECYLQVGLPPCCDPCARTHYKRARTGHAAQRSERCRVALPCSLRRCRPRAPACRPARSASSQATAPG